MVDAIRMRCPACGKALKLKGQLAGKRVKCPGCQGALSVPHPAESAEDGQPSRHEAVPKSPVDSPAAVKSKSQSATESDAVQEDQDSPGSSSHQPRRDALRLLTWFKERPEVLISLPVIALLLAAVIVFLSLAYADPRQFDATYAAVAGVAGALLLVLLGWLGMSEWVNWKAEKSAAAEAAVWRAPALAFAEKIDEWPLEISCRHCHRRITIEQDDAGEAVVCESCLGHTKVDEKVLTEAVEVRQRHTARRQLADQHEAENRNRLKSFLSGEPLACFDVELLEQPDWAAWRYLPHGTEVVEAGNKQQWEETIRLATEFLKGVFDHGFGYYWLGQAYRGLGEHGRARALLLQGVLKASSKYMLYVKLGEVAWDQHDLDQAARWWILSAVSQFRGSKGRDHSPFVYLSCVAEGFRQPEIQRALLRQADAINSGQIRLDEGPARQLINAARLPANADVGELLQQLNREFLQKLWIPGKEVAAMERPDLSACKIPHCHSCELDMEYAYSHAGKHTFRCPGCGLELDGDL